MDAITALITRNSANLLEQPGPSKKQLDIIIRAGLRACDHRNLRPWKYLLIEGDDRLAFGELLVKTKSENNTQPLSKEDSEKTLKKALRAPVILVIVAKIQPHDKVPNIEQVLSAGASAQMMMTAAYAQGLGAIWRSGDVMFSPIMKKGLGLSIKDEIIGFIYIGTAKVTKPLPALNPADFLENWPPK